MIMSHLHEVRTINVVPSVNISSRTAIAHLVAPVDWQQLPLASCPTALWAYSKMRRLKHSLLWRLLVVYSPLGLFKDELFKTLIIVMIISSLPFAYSKLSCLKHSLLWWVLVVYSPFVYSKMSCLKHSLLWWVLVVYSALGLFKDEALKTLTTVMIISSLLIIGLIQRWDA